MGVDQDVIQGTAFHTWKKKKYRFVENKALINLLKNKYRLVENKALINLLSVKRYQMYHFRILPRLIS